MLQVKHRYTELIFQIEYLSIRGGNQGLSGFRSNFVIKTFLLSMSTKKLLRNPEIPYLPPLLLVYILIVKQWQKETRYKMSRCE